MPKSSQRVSRLDEAFVVGLGLRASTKLICPSLPIAVVLEIVDALLQLENELHCNTGLEYEMWSASCRIPFIVYFKPQNISIFLRTECSRSKKSWYNNGPTLQLKLLSDNENGVVSSSSERGSARYAGRLISFIKDIKRNHYRGCFPINERGGPAASLIYCHC